ncbi:hypothetical protein [Terrabacter sp. NPDC080008]|uniref:hypothetical protein n=1 Tax=Terrabacter sp. NPDC080008 TaxID=3155176 RepID=UPI00344FF50D
MLVDDTDEIDTLLRATAAPVTVADAAEQSARIAAQVVSVSLLAKVAQRQNRRRRRVVGLAAVSILVPGIAVAGQQFVARSGVFGQPGLTESDTSEWINVCARDFPRYMRTVPLPSDALPAGSSWSSVVAEVTAMNVDGVGQGCTAGPSFVQASGLRSGLLLAAQRRWTCTALREHTNGNAPLARAAAEQVATLYDRLASTGRLGDRNWTAQQAAAARGDFAALKDAAAVNFPTGYCSTWGQPR